MPQLNPDPWFMTLVVYWIIYVILMSKINNFKTTKEFVMKDKNIELQSWILMW
uniref:ATP synthase complex subunit 8 n=1 Tax=Ensatina eschscholtzii TaxID=57550 RepID=Q645A6_9SALA|nr:ATP synthase F0 subunit 8 [Ensatina eschscholtzii]AAU20478.1 ATP synthase F0 subunit 8 [Ensatina eschscholtzii]